MDIDKEVGCVIVDVQGKTLVEQDLALLAHPQVAGVILFERNYQSGQQLSRLIDGIKKIKPTAIICTDHEGGRVQRFLTGFTKLPSMHFWGHCYEKHPYLTVKACKRLLGIAMEELQHVGINCNLMPVLDLNHGLNTVIGERSTHHDPSVVIDVASAIISVAHKRGLPAIGKHFPGHGGVAGDSHLMLPVDNRSLEVIIETDLKPFIALINKLDAIMPAHVLYPQVDADRPASLSSRWLIDILRERFQFPGLVMSDCLTMSALCAFGSHAERAQAALSAGCDLLIVSHDYQGACEVLDAVGKYSDHKASKARIMAFKKRYKMMN